MARLGGKVSRILLSGRRFHRLRSSSSSSSSSHSPSHSPSRPEGFEKYVCFWAYNPKRDTEWYVFNVTSNDFKYKKKNKRKIAKEKKRNRRLIRDGLIPFPEKGPSIHHHYGDKKRGMGLLFPVSVTKRPMFDCCVALGSIIYRLGGGNEVRTVRCFNTTCPDNCWNKGPRMIIARLNPHAVVLDGKLYVMGGVYRDKAAPWVESFDQAEVFDPCLGKWELLPPPPPSLSSQRHRFFSAALEGSKRILVGFYESNVIYTYDVMTKSWGEFDHDMKIRGGGCADRRGQPVVVGQTLYWFMYSGELYAYDLDLKMWFLGSIKGLEREFVIEHLGTLSFVPCFLHLGGEEFCLLWSEKDYDTDHELMRVHCVKFQVFKCTDNGFLDAFVESCQSYCIQSDICFLDGLLLDGRIGAENILEEESSFREVVDGGRMIDDLNS